MSLKRNLYIHHARLAISSTDASIWSISFNSLRVINKKMYTVPVCLAKKKKGRKEKRNDLSEYKVLRFLIAPGGPEVTGQVQVRDGFLLSDLIFNILIFNPKAMCLIS